MSYTLKRSSNKGKKFMIITPDNKTIHYGASGAEDYLIHKDKERKKRYIARHKKNENWNKSGINTAGFWSRWYSWNKPTKKESVKDIEKRFNIKIKDMT